MQKTEKQKILRLLERSFEAHAWHGPSVKEALAGITREQSLRKVSDNTHSIIALVAHMTAWRTYVIHRLQGDSTYDVTDAMDFPDVTDWPAAVQALEESQKQLIRAIEAFPEENLAALVPHSSKKYTFYTLLHGIIHHDLYHTGQISLLQKAFTQA